ncbi:isocitrate lyase/phosphoenolpyruvate mutase family protein [Paludisphaera borealis]|uniref:isocitrate lyase/phosphoenolpyruvate mutase family protein n=1 Tax=Paludisphaera borealis TaxID=1387353 RepID=UPI003B8396A8
MRLSPRGQDGPNPCDPPLNVLAIDPKLGGAELAELGVRRISIGGTLARIAWPAMLAAAE